MSSYVYLKLIDSNILAKIISYDDGYYKIEYNGNIWRLSSVDNQTIKWNRAVHQCISCIHHEATYWPKCCLEEPLLCDTCARSQQCPNCNKRLLSKQVVYTMPQLADMQIKVVTLLGATYDLNVSQSWTGDDLMTALIFLDLPVNSRALFKGQRITSETTLGSLGVEAESTINLVLMLRGD